MPWHTPITWVADQLVTETQLNQQLRDNLSYLKERVDAPASAAYFLNESADYSTTSTTFVDIDPFRLSFTLNTSGRALMIGFHGVVAAATTTESIAYFDVTVDGVRVGGDDGLTLVARKTGAGNSAAVDSVAFVVLVEGISAGEHIFRLQWRISGGSMLLRAGAGTASFDVHPQFWVREVS